MDVSRTQQLIQLLKQLQRQERDILKTGGHLLQLRTESAIAAKDKMQTGIVLQPLREGRQHFQTLFHAKIAGVEQYDLIIANAQLAADLVRTIERPNGIDVHPV